MQDLINEHLHANANPDGIPLTYTSKVFDPATSYLWWGGKKNRFDEFNSTEKEMLKQKFFKIIFAQYKFGQMIPYFDWPGDQILYWGGADFGTDAGSCEFLAPIVSLMERWSFQLQDLDAGSYPGEINGITLLLDAETFDNGPSTSAAEGFKVGVLHYRDMLIMGNTGINVDVGSATQVAVAAKLVVTSDQAYQRFSPEDRGCYFNEEIKMVDFNLDVGIRYEMTNCLFQAATDKILSECECNTAHLNVSGNICRGQKLVCLNKVNAELGRLTEVWDTKTQTIRKCLSACNTTSYADVTVGSSSFPNMAAFVFTKYSCILAKKLVQTCADFRRFSLETVYPGVCKQIQWLQENNGFCVDFQWKDTIVNKNDSLFDFMDFGSFLTKYARENTVKLNVYMREPFAETLGIDEDTSVMDFVSMVGGLLGLCMGFSFVSVAEILYYSSTGIFGYLTGAGRINDVGRRVRRKEEALKANSVEPF